MEKQRLTLQMQPDTVAAIKADAQALGLVPSKYVEMVMMTVHEVSEDSSENVGRFAARFARSISDAALAQIEKKSSTHKK